MTRHTLMLYERGCDYSFPVGRVFLSTCCTFVVNSTEVVKPSIINDKDHSIFESAYTDKKLGNLPLEDVILITFGLGHKRYTCDQI